LVYYIISFHNLAFLSIAVTVGNLEATKSVTAAYQETAGLNISGRKVDKLIILITVKPLI